MAGPLALVRMPTGDDLPPANSVAAFESPAVTSTAGVELVRKRRPRWPLRLVLDVAQTSTERGKTTQTYVGRFLTRGG